MLAKRLDPELHRSLQDINYWAPSYESIAELDAYKHGDYLQGHLEYDCLTMADLAYSINDAKETLKDLEPADEEYATFLNLVH